MQSLADPDIGDFHDVGVADVVDRPCLGEKTRDDLWVLRHFRPQDLDCRTATDHRMFGVVDRAHAATAQLCNQPVAAEDSPDQAGRLLHRQGLRAQGLAIVAGNRAVENKRPCRQSVRWSTIRSSGFNSGPQVESSCAFLRFSHWPSVDETWCCAQYVASADRTPCLPRVRFATRPAHRLWGTRISGARHRGRRQNRHGLPSHRASQQSRRGIRQLRDSGH